MLDDRQDDSSGRREEPESRLFDVAMARATAEDEEVPELDERARARMLMRILRQDGD